MSWMRRARNLFRSNRHSRDLDRELEFHLVERIDDLVAAGMSRDGATVEARRRFGNYGAQKERTRDADIFTWLDTLVADLRYAVRALRHSRGFTVAAVLSLALGIGANTAIFTLINAVILRSLPVNHPEELVQVTMAESGPTVTNPIWEQFRDHQDAFSGAFAYGEQSFNLASGGEVRNAAGSFVSGDFFRALGVQPAAGRLLSVQDDQRGCAPIAVLSYTFWQSEFGGDANVVGKTLSLTSHPFRIVGVTQAGFVGVEVGRAVQVFVPLCSDLVLNGAGNSLDARSNWWLNIIARPKAGMSPAQVHNHLVALSPAVFAATVPERRRADQEKQYLATMLVATPAGHGLSDLRDVYRRPLLTLMVIVGLVLLIACANVANLLLARAAARQREFAIRVALGAARSRLIRQLLTESLLLSIGSALLGLAFAQWGTRILVAMLSSRGSSTFLDLGLDGRVLGFSMAVAILTGLAFGLAPAWKAARVAPNAALKNNGRGVVEGQRRFTVSKTLVVAQIAVSLTLIVGAGLLLGTLRNLATLDPGFKPDDILIASITHPDTRASGVEQGAAHDAVLRRLRALPRVASASLSRITPLGNSGWNDEVLVDGFTPSSRRDAIAFFNEISDGYFRTLETPLLSGRDFNAGDRAGAPAVAIVNEAFAARFYHTASPIGRTFRNRAGKSISEPVEIVGVVKDAKYQRLREQAQATAFVPLSRDTASGRSINAEIRVAGGGAASITPSVKAELAAINPGISVTFVTFATQVGNSIRRERLLATLSGFFGALALLLATLGLYGVMSYNVARRKNEIGIRMALGAGQRRVASMVLGEVTVVVCVGFVFGVALALATTRLIASFLFGVQPTDAATFGGSMALLAAVALLAAYLPARRASRVDPMDALRDD